MSAKGLHKYSTAMEVVEGHDLTGYNILVTGGNSGIGVETVRALAKAGGNVFFTSRNVANGQKVADEIIESTGNKNVHVEQLELDSLDNVRDFVQRFLAKDLPLHILINNAGIMACPLARTKDGFESQFGTNHLGHFALTTGLMPALKAAAKASNRKTRVVSLSSVGHGFGDVDFEDFNFDKKPYETWQAYGQSKTANALFSVGLTERYEKEGVVSNSVMPGFVRTPLMRHMNSEQMEGYKHIEGKEIPAGASTTVWAAVAEELEGKGGLYLENCGYTTILNDFNKMFGGEYGCMSYIFDKKNAEKL